MKYCSMCNETFNNDVSFCPVCGKKLVERNEGESIIDYKEGAVAQINHDENELLECKKNISDIVFSAILTLLGAFLLKIIFTEDVVLERGEYLRQINEYDVWASGFIAAFMAVSIFCVAASILAEKPKICLGVSFVSALIALAFFLLFPAFCNELMGDRYTEFSLSNNGVMATWGLVSYAVVHLYALTKD